MNKIVEQAIDSYIKSQVDATTSNISQKLESFVNRIFNNENIASQDYPLVIGLALDSHRIDVIEQTINKAVPSDKVLLLNCTVKYLSYLDTTNEFYLKVLDLVVHLLMGLPEPDYITACQVKITLIIYFNLVFGEIGKSKRNLSNFSLFNQN